MNHHGNGKTVDQGPYVTGVLLAALSNGTRLGYDLPEVLTAMFNPLPAVALLPLALLWFGLGIGWFIYENKNQLEIGYVFAGLLTVIAIGVAMGSLFRVVEQRTVNRWGMRS